MCCIANLPTPTPAPAMSTRQRRRHRKSASMDSYFCLSALTSKDFLAPTVPRVAPAPLKSISTKEAAAPEEREDTIRHQPESFHRRAHTEDFRDSTVPDFLQNISFSRTTTCSNRRHRKRKTVRFSTVHIREHEIVIGDSPSCDTGIPISLGWGYASSLNTKVDSYERSREGVRKTCSGNIAADELQLSRRKRMTLLAEVGGYAWKDLVREERRLRMRERAEFFGRKAPTN
uniref:Uncharacterized protein n=1 Tax=Odontella aurita TaxID=265563 RepID=A0A7S4K9D1_9STRA|mmetsp:Transcript_7387/g.21790  ORF Transcript_7387/g.21790 Transcript_7387/m.21790 type:complete len:231 (+) Transcript_7387:237-929(+)